MLIVTDIEATCWETGNPPGMSETIEIGAVKVDLARGLILDRFSQLIKPEANPKLSDYCTNLTSITQKDIDRAHDFPTGHNAFKKFYGNRRNIFVSWGRYDINQLLTDCNRYTYHEEVVNSFLGSVETINLSSLFKNIIGSKKGMGLQRALAHLGMEFEGTPHRGVDDAYNTARIAIKLLSRGG